MKISEVSSQCGVSTHTLRYYEQIGLLSPISRNNGGIRDYSELDVRRVEFIKCMRSAGLTIEILLEYFKLLEQGDHTIEDRKQILVEQREKLLIKMAEMQETLDLLDYKISVYEKALAVKERELIEMKGVQT
jgi:DNA-binding transcriptional MerR regulator